MNKIILSSGIEGIDWRQSLNLLVGATSNISHFDNVMLNTKGKYDDLVFAKAEVNAAHKKLKPQLKGYLTRLFKNEKSQVSVLSDPIFLHSGATMQTLNSDKTFAFFFCSPEYYFAKMEGATSDGVNIDQQECLDNWLEDASKMWEFYVCYPDSTLLINIEDVARDPWSNASKIFEFVGCEIDDIDNNQAPNSVDTAMLNPIEKLSLLLLQNMKLETIKASSELSELYANLALTSILADSALSYDASERAGMRLSECQKLINVISTRQVQLESDSATFAASNSELIVDVAKLKSEFTSRTSALESSLSELTAENELALLQTNQLQEELESTYLNAVKVKGELAVVSKSLGTQLAKFKAENELAAVQINELKKELGTAYSNSKELKGESATRASAHETQLAKFKAENELAAVQINELKKELGTAYSNSKELKGESAMRASALETILSELTAENKLALLQINQLKEELGIAYSNSKELKGKSATRESALETSLSELTVKNELALLQINQLKEELEATYLDAKKVNGELVAGATALEASLSELTAENDLALLQINQSQEELEHYYIQYQKMTYSPNTEIRYATDLNRVKVSLSLMNMN
jgi:hypothetical protein